MKQVIGVGICVLFCSLLLKNRNKIFYEIAIIAGSVLIITLVVNQLFEIANSINEISSIVSSSVPYVKLMLKVLGISVITQILADTCRDNGEGALASTIEFCAKIISIALVLPLFETIITMVSGLVK